MSSLSLIAKIGALSLGPVVLAGLMFILPEFRTTAEPEAATSTLEAAPSASGDQIDPANSDAVLGTMTEDADGLRSGPDGADELQRGFNRPSKGSGNRGIYSPDSRV